MMRTRVRSLYAVLIVIFAASTPDPVQAQTGLRIEQWSTSTGSRVLFVRSPSIPMLDVNVDFDSGARFDPNGKAGLSTLTLAMLSKGIAADGINPALDEAGIAEAFATIGAQRGGGASDDRASWSLRTLTSEPELSSAVELSARILSRPTFPKAVFSREVERVNASLKEAETKPENIVQRVFSELSFGSHPYGIEPTRATISAVSRDDLVSFHRQYFRADRAVVAIIGAIGRAHAESIAERLTRDLPKSTAAVLRVNFDRATHRTSGEPEPYSDRGPIDCAWRPRLLPASSWQLRTGWRRFCITPVQRSARKARPRLQCVFLLFAGTRCRAVHDRPANTPRADQRGARGRARYRWQVPAVGSYRR
jgi:hypothetical protein